MSSSIRAVLFDLDDTLVDDEYATRLAAEKLVAAYRPELADQAYQSWQQALKKHYPSFLGGQLNASQMRQARIRTLLEQPELSEPECEAIFEQFMQHYIAATRVYSDTLACLQSLQQSGYRLGMVTNGSEQMQLRKLKAAGLDEYFEVVLTAERAGAGKPELAIYQQALDELGLTARVCAYVGDNQKNDALGSAQAGLYSLWLQREQQLKAEPLPGVAWQINNLEQVQPLLSGESSKA